MIQKTNRFHPKILRTVIPIPRTAHSLNIKYQFYSLNYIKNFKSHKIFLEVYHIKFQLVAHNKKQANSLTSVSIGTLTSDTFLQSYWATKYSDMVVRHPLCLNFNEEETFKPSTH